MSGTHEEMAALAPGYVLGALEPDERDAFEAHAAACALCAAEIRAFSRVVAGLAQGVPQVAPPPELRARVMGTIGRAGATVTRLADESRSPSPGDVRAVAVARSSALTWLPLAATVALAVGLGVYAGSLRQRVIDLEARLEQATARLLVADGAVAEARRVAFETQSATAVLVAPDLARIDLRGEGDAPAASARALWSRARGMVFTATNLPRLPSGRVYQVWVVTANAPLSAGLVEPDADGRAIAVFSTPPDIPAPVAVAVTLEPAGGVPAPTGPRYLLGTPTL